MNREALLSNAELEEELKSLQGWKVEEGKRIVKSYLFPTFPDAVAFVNRVAETAEAMNHHPFISIDYRRVTLRLTTWNSGGLTQLDIDSAKAYDGWSINEKENVNENEKVKENE
ncbi:4a-hydroxytetrahydrobiopterin dehydratase [Paenibacillus beijingensis]|uniref:Putative pterin-4-alpha-carbinolamine dehydratase n=1 Tax=Paenibacillus beijingensis TaxID=1126833 RepID=A0A0D5NIU6_9BACL|nr:4a-hydroxytetrahydrobiopterin dehydratase [Paenibacillus beijingensis]AJY75176.1 pterin-4-alpha-carbinolamine dehydratase [Paenibacillus beijingensis]